MIGTTVVLGERAGNVKGVSALKESWHKYESILSRTGISVSYVHYNGYPIRTWVFNHFLIVQEGIIYNIEESTIQARIRNIIDGGLTDTDVSSFVKDADGDYCFYIINEDEQSVLAFNDILGGIPLFYALDGDSLFISRQFGLISLNIHNKMWSSANIAEYLSFGYNLRTRTFSSSIYKFEPASILRANCLDSIKFEYKNLYIDDFCIDNRYRTKDEAADALASLFLDSCKRRVEYAKKNGYTIVNTMSGGFDSRTVAGGIEKYADDYINITYQYLQDESSVAKEVLDALESKGKYTKLSFHNQPDLFNKELSLNTDGRINAYTNSICYHDMLSVRSHFGDKKILYFGGFGGEFIRHPKFETLIPFAKLGTTYSPTFFLTSRICNTTVDTLSSQFLDSFKGIKKNGDCRFKDYYNEYYQNLVRCSGEDRTRMFYFTVQPMMGKDFILAIRHKVPLKWVGFEFYKMFLNKIDKRLTTVNVFGHDDGYLDDKNLRKIDFKRRVLEYYLSPIRYMYKRLMNTELRVVDNTISYDEFAESLDKVSNKDIFNETFLASNYARFSKTLKYRLISIVSFISSIDNS